MAFKDVREYIDVLEKAGELLHIKEEVNWELELGTIMRRAAEMGEPACCRGCGLLHIDRDGRCAFRHGAICPEKYTGLGGLPGGSDSRREGPLHCGCDQVFELQVQR